MVSNDKIYPNKLLSRRSLQIGLTPLFALILACLGNVAAEKLPNIFKNILMSAKILYFSVTKPLILKGNKSYFSYVTLGF